MRIAILTQPLGHNYGGILQNYALQQVLQKLGHNSITIEKDPYQHITNFQLLIELPKRFFTKYILKKRDYILSEKRNNALIKQNWKRLFPFVSKYINHLYVKSYDSVNINDFNVFLVGSDQIWRPVYNRGSMLSQMYLNFIPKGINIKRIAYGASFGSKEWEYDEEQTKRCAELVQRFDAISMREIDGISLCAKHLNRNDAISVLDPTLLLDKKDYLQLCSNINPLSDNILFAYILDKNDATIYHLEKIANQKNLKLQLVSADHDCTHSVVEWVTLFRDAECVITDSFHGTVFSIIFNKEFYTIANQSRGGSRFTSLLSQLSLTDRMFASVSDIKINKNIDWGIISDKIDTLRNESLNFLKASLT